MIIDRRNIYFFYINYNICINWKYQFSDLSSDLLQKKTIGESFFLMDSMIIAFSSFGNLSHPLFHIICPNESCFYCRKCNFCCVVVVTAANNKITLFTDQLIKKDPFGIVVALGPTKQTPTLFYFILFALP